MVCAALEGIPYREFYELLYYQKLIFCDFILTNALINFYDSQVREPLFRGFTTTISRRVRDEEHECARLTWGALLSCQA